MRIVRLSLIFLLTVLFASQVFSRDRVDDENAKEESAVKEEKAVSDSLVFLPFYDYTGSSMKYLSGYIPELIVRGIAVEKGLRIYDPVKLRDDIKERKLNPEMLYDKRVSLDFLKNINAYIGVMGRYIIQGKTIRVDYHVIHVDSGKIVEGDPFEGIVDDNLLGTVERFAYKSTEWLRLQALSDVITKLEEKKKSKIKKLFERVKSSKAGIVFRNKWLFSLFILILFYLLSKLIVLFFEKVLKRFASRSETSIDDNLINISRKPVKWILIFVGVKLALLPLKLPAKTSLFFSNLTTVVMIAIITYIIFKGSEIIIRFWGEKVADKIDSRIDDDLVPLFVKIAKIFIAIMGTLLILSKFGVEIGPLIASLGIAGFAIGFAVKDSLSNIIGGIILILDKSFVVGDKVTVDGDTGVIKEIGLRNTRLKTFDNEIIIIPNGDLMNKKFKNYVLPDPTIRVVVNFGVAYGTDVDKVEEVVLKAIRTIAEVVDDPAPIVVFNEMGESSLDFQAKFWIPLYDNQYGKKIEATKKIYNALNEASINIPFPTRTLYIEKEE